METLMNELSQGKELTEKLIANLQQSSPQDKSNFLVEQILSSYEKALSMLNQTNHNTLSLESPTHSLGNSSPTSVFFDQETSTPRDVSKKRKKIPKWSEKVKVCLGTGNEVPLEDGYSWRKYGQKDILGSIHRRGYYRCTHRHSQGCLAIKQVQRSDQDSSLLEVTYRERHTCYNRSSRLSVAKQDQQEKSQFPHLDEKVKNQSQSPSPSTFFNLKPGLEVETEDLDTMGGQFFSPFSFPSTPIDSESVVNPFLSDVIMDSSFQSGFSDSDLAEILSTRTSVTNSPIGDYDFDFTIDKSFYELSFPFDSPEFTS